MADRHGIVMTGSASLTHKPGKQLLSYLGSKLILLMLMFRNSIRLILRFDKLYYVTMFSCMGLLKVEAVKGVIRSHN